MSTAVLLHGFAFGRAVWEGATEGWGFDEILPISLPGYDGTPALPASGSRHLADQTVANLLARAPRGATWIGWSLGGMQALAAAARDPAHIKKLVMIAASPKFVARADWAHAMPEAHLLQFEKNLAENTLDTLARFAMLTNKGKRFSTHAPQSQRLAHLLSAEVLPPLAVLRQGLQLLQELDLRAALRDLRVPLLVITGACDPLVNTALAAEMRVLQPRAHFVSIEDGGHAPFLSHPLAVQAALQNFCQQHL